MRERPRPIQIMFARRMRTDPTPSENLLWQRLRRCQLRGMEFRRQHPIPSTRFIADFYCRSLKLIIEIDGGYHDSPDQADRDAERQTLIAELGYTFLRFPDKEVIESLENVLDIVQNTAARLSNAAKPNDTGASTPLSPRNVGRGVTPLC